MISKRVQRANHEQIPSASSSFLFGGRLGMRFERGSIVGRKSRVYFETMISR